MRELDPTSIRAIIRDMTTQGGLKETITFEQHGESFKIIMRDKNDKTMESNVMIRGDSEIVKMLLQVG